MPLATERTREVFWGMPGWAELLWYVLAFGSVLVFAYGVARPIAKYRRGRAVDLPSRRELPGRMREAIRLTFSQVNIARRDGFAGWAHRGIFYGFLVLFVGTVILAINTDFTEPVFGWRFFEGDFYVAYSLVLDVLGLALLIGLLMMAVRRGVRRPQKLDYTRPDRAPDDPQQRGHAYRVGDWVFVGMLLYLVLGGYVLEGLRLAIDEPTAGDYSPIGWIFAQGWSALEIGDAALGALRRVVWWSHGLVALAFVAAIPYTKAAHMLTAFASLVLRDPDAERRLRPIPEERAAEPAGYGTLADFSVGHLLQLDACTRCGKCHEACPAAASGLPLSPRDVVLELREEANTAMAGVGIGGVLGTLLRGEDPGGSMGREVIGEEEVRVETLWSCMQCNACVEACPVAVEQAPIINQMRRRLVEEGEIEPGIQGALEAVHKSGNSFGERRRSRGKWTEELEFEVKDARKEPVDVLWFVGDYASFDPRSQQITRGLARLLDRAGVDFGILYEGERNSGNDVRRIGEEGLYESLAEHNVELISACEFNRIMTTDPHSLNTLRNEYGYYGGDWEVIHHTALLVELLAAGRLDLSASLSYRVTFHDPCHLGRMNGEYDDPREILALLGCELVEMPRNRDNSFCCGAGGGQIWASRPAGAERPSENRIREALSLGEIDLFVVTCPKDVAMYEDAIKTTGSGERLVLRELTELVEEAVLVEAAPAPAGAGSEPPGSG